MTSSTLPPEHLLGRTLGERYRLLQLLGSGGIGHVYLAERLLEPGSGLLAVKVLRPDLEGRREAVLRFEREALAASKIRHPHVIEVFGPVERAHGVLYFAMELLVGVDLADALASSTRLQPARAIRVALGAAAGLGAAHAAGVVHRDVKPENLFLVHRADGREVPKVLDFGAAFIAGDPSERAAERITSRASVVGTPGYLSPEQAEGVVAEPTADVYALGVTMHEMLTGQPPYRGHTWLELLHRQATEPVPEIPFVSEDLRAVLVQSMARHPHDRFQSMEALARALSSVPEASGR